MTKRDTTKRDEKAVADYQAGRLIKDILAEAGMSAQTLYTLLRTQGIEPYRHPALLTSRIRALQKMVRQGLSMAEAGRRLDPPISRQRVYQILKKETL